MTKTILTGIKPTGSPHIGNLIGAIKPMIEMANSTTDESFIFIADIHALNGQKDPKFIRDKTYELVAMMLAFDLDVDKTTLYRQSDISEIFELSTILMNYTPKGLMNRAHAYKSILDKDGNDDNVNMGLFTYPVLMTADILAMNADIVPVGLDQKQHIEIARDIANSFNKGYNTDILKMPTEKIVVNDSVIGLDGRKMSKSYGNTIEVFEEEETTIKKIMKIPTDSLNPNDAKTKDSALYKMMENAGMGKTNFMKEMGFEENFLEHYLNGGIGYGDAKKKLAEFINKVLEIPRSKYKNFIKDQKLMTEILIGGSIKARPVAAKTLLQVKQTLGLI